MPGLVVLLVGASKVCSQGHMGTVESSFMCYVRPALGRDLTQVSVRFGTTALGFNKLFQNQLLRRSSNRRFLSPGLFRQGSPRSCVHGTVSVQSSHSWISPLIVRLIGSPALIVPCPLLSFRPLLTSSVSVRMSTSIRPRADVNESLFAAHLVISNCSVALDGFTRLDWHLVVSLWWVLECVPAVISLAQKFVRLAAARFSFHPCQHGLAIVVAD